MLSREQAITRLSEYGVPFSEDAWQREAVRKEGEFGIFAIIIRVIAGLFILGMVIVSIAGFVAILGLDDNWEHVVGAIGVLATMFAAWQFRHTYKALEKQFSFRGLLYLSLLLVGKACLLLALFGWFGSASYWRDGQQWFIAGGFALITLVSCLAYRMYLEAFLSVLASLFLLDAALGFHLSVLVFPAISDSVRWTSDTQVSSEIISIINTVNAFRLLLICAVFATLVWLQKRRVLSSVFVYAIGMFLGFDLLPVDKMYAFFGNWPSSQQNVSVALIAFAASLALYAFLIGGWQKLKSLEHVIVICCIVILAVLGMHGVLFAIALMALGHMRHDRVLWVIGLIYLPVYLFLFYFSLDVTLLAKSYMLLGSGIFILAARFVLTRFFNPKGLEVENA